MTIRRSISNKVYEITDRVIVDMKTQGFDRREGQVNVMYTVISAFESNENMLIEAGVGTGKSFGYLVPGILISYFTGKPLIVATSTIQLTEQLVKDIDTVRKLLTPYLKGRKVNSVIGKGKNNYPCICTVKNKIETTGKRIYVELLDKIEAGVDRQNPNGIPRKYWNEITKHECTSTKGFDRKNCYFYQMRAELTKQSIAKDIERIFDPRVLVINQDLLINHYKNIEIGRNPILHENPCLLIIDELHNLEEKTRTALTTRVDINSSLSALSQVKFYGEMQITELEIESLRKSIEKIYDSINREVKKEINKDDPLLINEKITISSRDVKIDDLIINIRDILTAFILNTEKKEYYSRNRYKSIENELENLLIFLQAYNNSNDNYIVWAEINNQEKGFFSIYYCPGDIGKTLKSNIFTEPIPTVGMSATITNNLNMESPYEYIIDSIGFDENKGSWEYSEESEFNYNKSNLFIPKTLPDQRNRNNNYYLSISELISNIISGCVGDCLVLFTSKYDMVNVHKKLINKVDDVIYLDDDNLTPKEILNDFEKTKGIILSAGSFWEGIDLKGELLTNLIVVRIPFPVPDPVIENKISRLGNRDDVLVPEMIMKLKQGTGRLIRSKSDIGVVSILDSRLNLPYYKYKEIIYNELPFKNHIYEIEEVKKFQYDNKL